MDYSITKGFNLRRNRSSVLLTFDVEDWFQVKNLRPWISPLSWETRELRVEESTGRILDLLDAFKERSSGPVRATFFVLGWIAERLPGLIREIAGRGHEIASHGFGHDIYSLPEQKSFSYELRACKKRLEEITGHPVFGYRAPNFSMDSEKLKALRSAGFLYDSSSNAIRKGSEHILPGARTGRFGVVSVLCDGFYELPISNLSFAGLNIPWGGGGYFRLIPLPLFLRGVRRILLRGGAYIFYSHPWEFDPAQPRVSEAGLLPRFRHYLNLDKTFPRLVRLIEGLPDACFLTCKQYIDMVGKNHAFNAT